MEREYVKTFVEGEKESISDLEKGDVIYVKKNKGGYDYYWEVSFEGIKNGVVYGKVLRESWNGNKFQAPFHKGKVITARKSKCFIWGDKKVVTTMSSCHWL